MSSDSLADAILAQFPGPVTLAASRRKWALMLVGCGAFTAIGITLVPKAIDDWLGVIFFGTGTIGSAAMLLPGAGMLRLDRDAFETTSLLRRRRRRWQAVSGFRAWSFGMTGAVVYDDINKSRVMAKLNAAFCGRNAGLPDTYGLSARDLADLMTRWRERALSHAPSHV